MPARTYGAVGARESNFEVYEIGDESLPSASVHPFALISINRRLTELAGEKIEIDSSNRWPDGHKLSESGGGREGVNRLGK